MSTDSQESNAMMPLKRATLLRGSASPRANFFWRATQNGYCFAAALCVNSPRTALRCAGEEPGDSRRCLGTDHLRGASQNSFFARNRAPNAKVCASGEALKGPADNVKQRCDKGTPSQGNK
jgi:hypothetical protein